MRLQVVAGPALGMAYRIVPGPQTIGRDEQADLVLPDPDVSRRHAQLSCDGETVTLADIGSTNGTFRNGDRIVAPVRLRPGDVIGCGRSRLAYVPEPEAGTSGAHPGDARRSPPAATGVPRVRFGRVMLVGGLVEAVGLLAAGVVTLVGKTALSTPLWLLTPVAAVVAGMVKAATEAAAGPAHAPAGGTRTNVRTGVPVWAAVLAVLLVIGVGGYGVAAGARYAIGWVTGDEPRTGGERLAAAPRSDRSGQVTVKVTSIANTRHFTKVTMAVTNGEDEPATLTLYANCVLSAGDVTLEADTFRSDWADTVPPGSTQKGVVTFAGHLPPGAATAQLSINRVFVFGRFGKDDSIVIRSIPLRAA
ncbi:FHA domain-containing protein [Jidongwangia harbinensis]|uniref:FHA domain-containing protein n=1 Tax=Jidongwangia harbinensis TaxID=2878561 RepID=UPI001CD9E26C|nr:FHA domain-containing protein [Jidongwangia harbinensis]MCA2219219.1 FHA domain-containing protein [Jidongwangia harbinensis]